jgi:hypothetical protein
VAVLVPVHGQYFVGNGQPATFGAVTFIPTFTWLTDATAAVELVGGSVQAALDATGTATINLRATDDPALVFTKPWYWKVVEDVALLRRGYLIEVPSSAVETGIDLATVVPVVPVYPSPAFFWM